MAEPLVCIRCYTQGSAPPCPTCGASELVPLDSPRGREILALRQRPPQAARARNLVFVAVSVALAGGIAFFLATH